MVNKFGVDGPASATAVEIKGDGNQEETSRSACREEKRDSATHLTKPATILATDTKPATLTTVRLWRDLTRATPPPMKAVGMALGFVQTVALRRGHRHGQQ